MMNLYISIIHIVDVDDAVSNSPRLIVTPIELIKLFQYEFYYGYHEAHIWNCARALKENRERETQTPIIGTHSGEEEKKQQLSCNANFWNESWLLHSWKKC